MKEETPNTNIQEMLKNPIVKFLIKAAIIYGAWEFMNWFQMHNAPFNKIWMGLHSIIKDNIVDVSAWLLRLMQFNIEKYEVVVRIVGSPGVAVGPACVGFGLLFGFAGLIMSYHGSVKSKLWFIPLGLLGIHIINILRIVVLAIISNINNDWVDFNHKYVFNTVIYIFIFVMWMWWVRYVDKEENKKTSENSH
ncbi:MAG: exosortase/archaeosortase family protein [Bacteroidia bacterium]|nr:exosortase/archaeosortase family protein [Bacteroidia bacterium]MCZ2247272.1 exosortase/archaeosortase family protein [Bacteroidia bacterium]